MSSNIQIRKTCLFCGREFFAKTTVTQYCSAVCSQRAYKKRKRKEKIEKFSISPSEVPVSEPILPRKEKDFLSWEQVAELMGICRMTVYKVLRLGENKQHKHEPQNIYPTKRHTQVVRSSAAL